MGLKPLRNLPRFWKRKKEKAAKVEKPEIEKVPEREFPEISTAEQKKYIGKHVAIVDGKIVTSAGAAKKTLETAKQEHSGKEIGLRYVANEKLLIKCKCLEKS
ncbi:MAG: DUF5678 domain-containing protein [Hadesarchaea archaeon]|nr:DUF5678 domain-containing protein [Hadesarchaea archaeon]